MRMIPDTRCRNIVAELSRQKTRGPLDRWATIVALVMICGWAACAKKLLPPSPDRFSPRLEEVRTRNRVRLELVFDEEIDISRLFPDSFTVRGPDDSELHIRGVVAGRRRNAVELWTMPQEPALYGLKGTVWDVAGNTGRLSSRFRGSDRRDTVPPRVTRITPEPGSAGRRVTIRVEFSEPMDTTSAVSWLLVPASLDSLILYDWERDWQAFSVRETGLGFATSRQPGSALQPPVPGAEPVTREQRGLAYFVLMPGTADLEGNRNQAPAFTYFTPDSVIDAAAVRGKVVWKDGPLGTGVVFFNSDKCAGLAPALSDGTFTARVTAGRYKVRAVADTNGDGIADISSRPVTFDTREESLELFLEPETAPRPIAEYR